MNCKHKGFIHNDVKVMRRQETGGTKVHNRQCGTCTPRDHIDEVNTWAGAPPELTHSHVASHASHRHRHVHLYRIKVTSRVRLQVTCTHLARSRLHLRPSGGAPSSVASIGCPSGPRAHVQSWPSYLWGRGIRRAYISPYSNLSRPRMRYRLLTFAIFLDQPKKPLVFVLRPGSLASLDRRVQHVHIPSGQRKQLFTLGISTTSWPGNREKDKPDALSLSTSQRANDQNIRPCDSHGLLPPFQLFADLPSVSIATPTC